MSTVSSPIERIAYGYQDRHVAVAAALELIKAELSAPNGTIQIGQHLESLSKYADSIEAALKKS
jgi:hypothetical protein